VGAIKIGATESRFEISAAAAERFKAALAASGGSEKSIRITPDGDGSNEGSSPSHKPRKPRTETGTRKPGKPNPDRPKSDEPKSDTPKHGTPRQDKPKPGKPKGPDGKKKPKWSRAKRKAAAAEGSGDLPLKRKTKKSKPKS
jgi:ATP-dependent RNA helicase DeaD